MSPQTPEAQLTEARAKLQNLIAQGLGGGEDHARLERRINALKTRIMRQTAENASVAASADSLARELNINVWDLVKTLAKGAGPATRLSTREAAILRTVYAPIMSCPRGCGIDIRNHHSSDSVNGGCDTGPMPVADMRDWFAARGVGQPGFSAMADVIAEHYGKTEDQLDTLYDAMHGA